MNGSHNTGLSSSIHFGMGVILPLDSIDRKTASTCIQLYSVARISAFGVLLVKSMDVIQRRVARNPS